MWLPILYASLWLPLFVFVSFFPFSRLALKRLRLQHTLSNISYICLFFFLYFFSSAKFYRVKSIEGDHHPSPKVLRSYLPYDRKPHGSGSDYIKASQPASQPASLDGPSRPTPATSNLRLIDLSFSFTLDLSPSPFRIEILVPASHTHPSQVSPLISINPSSPLPTSGKEISEENHGRKPRKGEGTYRFSAHLIKRYPPANGGTTYQNWFRHLRMMFNAPPRVHRIRDREIRFRDKV